LLTTSRFPQLVTALDATAVINFVDDAPGHETFKKADSPRASSFGFAQDTAADKRDGCIAQSTICIPPGLHAAAFSRAHARAIGGAAVRQPAGSSFNIGSAKYRLGTTPICASNSCGAGFLIED